jgi:hypothetical protein
VCRANAIVVVLVAVLLRNSSLECVLGAFGGVAGHICTGSRQPTVKSHEFEAMSRLMQSTIEVRRSTDEQISAVASRLTVIKSRVVPQLWRGPRLHG